MLRPSPSFVPILLVAVAVSCGVPEITERDHQTLGAICERGMGTNDAAEAARILEAVDGEVCGGGFLGLSGCPDWRKQIVGMCTKTDGDRRYHEVATTTVRRSTETREEICDGLRTVIPMHEKLTVFCRVDTACSTRCATDG